MNSPRIEPLLPAKETKVGSADCGGPNRGRGVNYFTLLKHDLMETTKIIYSDAQSIGDVRFAQKADKRAEVSLCPLCAVVSTGRRNTLS